MKCRLGLLAVALGDGTMQVLAVPHPGALATGQPRARPPEQPASGAGGVPTEDVPAVVELRPVAAAAVLKGSPVPSSVEWLPLEPHDRLLVRAWPRFTRGKDGTWRVGFPNLQLSWQAMLHGLKHACQHY